MGWFEDSGDFQQDYDLILDDLIEALIDGLGLNDSSVGGTLDKTFVAGYEFYAGMHYGVCHGPVDELTQISFEEKPAWVGSATPGADPIDADGYHLPVPRDQEDPLGEVDGRDASPNPTTPDLIVINQEKLFGGERQEGGVLGVVNILHGGPTQEVNNYLQTHLAADPAKEIYTPAYRGILSLVLHSDIKSFKDYIPKGPWHDSVIGTILAKNKIAKLSEAVTHHTGFYWGAMSAKLKVPSVHAFRAIYGWNTTGGCWYPETCIIERANRSGVMRKFMNPVHIAVQCLVDKRFGMKLDESNIGLSFRTCADIMVEEKFGLGLVWAGETSIRHFISEVMRYINGVIYLDPTTGKLEMSLIRAIPEGDIAGLPSFGPSQIIDPGVAVRPIGEEAVNTISVTYRRYASDKSETVTRSNTAMVATYGAVISETLDFQGIKHAGMAAEVCEREVRQRCSLGEQRQGMRISKLAPMDGNTEKSATFLHEGSPFRLYLPNQNINGQVYRVANINYGSTQNNFIEFDAVEDMFSKIDSDYITPGPDTGWENPNVMPPQLEAGDLKYFPTPYVMAITGGGNAALKYVPSDTAMFSLMATSSRKDITGFSVYVNHGGEPDPYNIYDPAVFIGDSSLCPTSELDGPLPLLTDDLLALKTTVKIKNMRLMSEYTVEGAWGIVGDEKILCTSIVTDEEDPDYLLMTVMRGVFDSVPAAHADGDRIWWVNGASAVKSNSITYKDTEVLTLWAASYGSAGGLQIGAASPGVPDVNVTNGWFAPYPPARVTIDGQLFPADMNEDFTIEWVCRNRVEQSDVPVAWDSDGISTEAGTTFTLDIYDADTLTLINSYTDIEAYGTTGAFSYNGGAGGASRYRLELYSQRNGRRSLQSFVHESQSIVAGGSYIDTQGVTCPKPVWCRTHWRHFDAAVAQFGGIGYTGMPPKIFDYYADSSSADFYVPYVSSSAYRPYKAKLECSWTVNPNPYSEFVSNFYFTDGLEIWHWYWLLTPTWTKPPAPTADLFISPATINSISVDDPESSAAAFNAVICMNGGADIYVTDSYSFASYTRKGTVGEQNELADLMHALWVKKIDGDYLACGVSLVDSTRTVMATSANLVSWTLKNESAPSRCRNRANWLKFPANNKWYIFDLAGGPSGSTYAFQTVNGHAFTAKNIGCPSNSPPIGPGLVKKTATGYLMQIMCGRFVISTENGSTWNLSRNYFSPEALEKCMSYAEPFCIRPPGDSTGMADVPLMFRSGRFIYDGSKPPASPEGISKGVVYKLDSLSASTPVILQPNPSMWAVGAVGDVSSGVVDGGFTNSGGSGVDVYTLLGKDGSAGGTYRFEAHVGGTGRVLIGVAATTGRGESVVGETSCIIQAPSGRLMSDIRIECPGGLRGGKLYSMAQINGLFNKVVGVALDLTAGQAFLYVDGVLKFTVSNLAPDLMWFPVFTSVATPIKMNFGDQPFQFPVDMESQRWYDPPV